MRRKERELLYRRLEAVEEQMIHLAISVGKINNTREVPEEPPPMSIVVDDYGYAYQREADAWWSPGDHHGYTWQQVCDICGDSMKIVYRGEDV